MAESTKHSRHTVFLVAYRLSGYGGINVGLPPASPSEGDLMITVSLYQWYIYILGLLVLLLL